MAGYVFIVNIQLENITQFMLTHGNINFYLKNKLPKIKLILNIFACLLFHTCLTENDGMWGHWVVGNDGEGV